MMNLSGVQNRESLLLDATALYAAILGVSTIAGGTLTETVECRV